MVIHKELTIQLGESQIKQLKSHYRQVIQHLEEGYSDVGEIEKFLKEIGEL